MVLPNTQKRPFARSSAQSEAREEYLPAKNTNTSPYRKDRDPIHHAQAPLTELKLYNIE
jgi:sigma54-dependent transcription regulator